MAKEIGFTQVSLSSDVMPMIKMVPRGFTGKVKKDEMDIKKKMVTGTGRKS